MLLLNALMQLVRGISLVELGFVGRRAGSKDMCRRLGNPYCTWPSSVWGPEGYRYSSGW